MAIFVNSMKKDFQEFNVFKYRSGLSVSDTLSFLVPEGFE